MITEQAQYRLVDRMWHSWNVDRMYMAGVQIRDRQHAGLNHQKSVIIYDQDAAAGDQTMVIFGSSNWTSPSASGQVEHNMFTTRSDLTTWFIDQFNRKWDNLASSPETKAFTPLPPDAPKNPLPADGAAEISTAAVLGWLGGPWAHLYDVYISADFNAVNSLNPSALVPGGVADDNTKKSATSRSQLMLTLQSGTTYYWRVQSKTMALMTKNGPVWRFTTAGTTPPPPPTGTAEVVLYASKATRQGSAWQVESDSTAAGGAKIRNPNLDAAKIDTPSATPANYFEMTFFANAGVGYHLWIRGKADGNTWPNDSACVQFDNRHDEQWHARSGASEPPAPPTTRSRTATAAGCRAGDGRMTPTGSTSRRHSSTSPTDGSGKRFACSSVRTVCQSTRSCSRTRST